MMIPIAVYIIIEGKHKFNKQKIRAVELPGIKREFLPMIKQAFM